MSKIDLSTNKISISPQEQPQNNQFQSITKKTNKNIQYRNNNYNSDFVKFENTSNLVKDEYIYNSVKSNNSSFKGSGAYKFITWNLEKGLFGYNKQKEKFAQTFWVPFIETVKKSVMSMTSPILFKGSESEATEAGLLDRLKNVQSREDFVVLLDEIKKMPKGEEKSIVVEAYLKAYNEWSKSPQRFDIRIECAQFKELTDAEFEAMKPQVEAVINSNAVLKENLNGVDLTKENIQVVKSVIGNCFEWLDKDSPKYNQNFVDKLGEIIRTSDILEKAKARADVIKCIKENCSEWLDKNNSKYNQIYAENVGEIINDWNAPESAQAGIDVIKCVKENCSEWFDINNLKYNKNFADAVKMIIRDTYTLESSKARIDIMKCIKENCSEWLDPNNSKYNQNFVDMVAFIVYISDTLESANSRIDVIKYIKENCSEWIDQDSNMYNQNIADKFWNIIYTSDIPERAKSKIETMKCIKENCSEWLDKNNSEYNKSFADMFWDVINYSDTSESAQAGIDVMKCIKENYSQWLDPNNSKYNQSFADKVPNIIYSSYSKELAEARINIMKCIKENYSQWLDKNNPKYNQNFADNVGEIIFLTETSGKVNFVKKLFKNAEEFGISADKILLLIEQSESITYKDVKNLNQALGKEKIAKLSETDFLFACKISGLANKNNINEIPVSEKKALIRSLVDCNDGMFGISDELVKNFPLCPRNQEQYCELLPSLVRSIGVETKQLKAGQIAKFNNALEHLSDNIAKISDEEFNNLQISQEFSINDFIAVVLDKIKDLTPVERQKVYDYFGFELHHKKNTKYNIQDEFTITGYPQNLNNGEKLVQIEDPKTKAVVESLRSDVIKFSENNKITTNNKDIDIYLNEVADALPEIRTMIGRKQHGTHDFDVMQHSLKVMQKISQDPQFKLLNDSDKKLMMIAALLHDITKAEGISDKTHAIESSLDTYFIAQKFNLSRAEQTKLNSLIKNHEWLSFVNHSKTSEIREKRMQDVAFDLQYDNLFEMSLMFTHADLKAVKKSDVFHDTTAGSKRVELNGKVRSYGEAAEIYAEKIRENIAKLKISRPILPVTKIPKADIINQAITKVNPDGSTNIKGVYKDETGLVVIKYNEVEDWEAIGFPKGSRSHGVFVDLKTTEKGPIETANTGNIKFFVHGLDYANQLAKFDAFSLPNNDALLSLSYAERPESKYRFYRPQGLLLDVDTQYIHGGGNTDSGSGCKKALQEFKDNYIFGGEREADRIYISNLVKEATGMSDTEYVKFVEDNKNKAMTEIEPEEIREKIIKAFATINSNTRKGNREYNEIYGSNPNPPMGVFAYSVDYSERIDNPIEFLNRKIINENEKVCGPDINSVAERTEFLKQYALENNLPFFIF